MSIEVIHNQTNAVSVWKIDINPLFDLQGPVLSSTFF